MDKSQRLHSKVWRHVLLSYCYNQILNSCFVILLDDQVLVRMVAQATLTYRDEGCGLKNCRFKRNNENEAELRIHLETPKVIFKHQQTAGKARYCEYPAKAC